MRYDVVLVPFPFDDLSGQKVRPAVCLSDAGGVHPHVVLAFVSSVLPSVPEPSDLLLTPAMPEFARTNLRVASALRLHRIVTISATVVRRRLGVLAPSIQTQVAQQLRTLFAI